MKIKKKTLLILIISIAIIVLIYSNYPKAQKDPYDFKGNTLNYLKETSKPKYNLELNQTIGGIEIYNINFPSRNFMQYNTTIYGLLFIPEGKKNIPGLVFLPGGGGTKEGVSNFASRIANEGYAVLTIDQRGIGQTGGIYLSIEQDFQAFSQGYEPIQHLSVYDGLKSLQVLRSIPQVDRNNIAITGESMGGRYALIAAAIDHDIKGVMVISSAGFNIQPNALQTGNDYLLSIDPDHYIDKISPNYLVMFQSKNDTVTTYESAKRTFDKANEPKRFFEVENCTHGFCEQMWPEIQQDLKILFSS